MYEKTTATTLPEACPTPQPKRSRADWERDMREVEEEKDNLKTLRNHDVPKYFDSELGKAFLLAQVMGDTLCLKGLTNRKDTNFKKEERIMSPLFRFVYFCHGGPKNGSNCWI